MKSFEQILFPDIREIVIIERRELSDPQGWFIHISTIQGKYMRIYSADDESDAGRIAEEISKITNKEISHRFIYDVPLDAEESERLEHLIPPY